MSFQGQNISTCAAEGVTDGPTSAESPATCILPNTRPGAHADARSLLCSVRSLGTQLEDP